MLLMYLNTSWPAFWGGKRNNRYVKPSSGNRIKVAFAAFLYKRPLNTEWVIVTSNEIVRINWSLCELDKFALNLILMMTCLYRTGCGGRKMCFGACHAWDVRTRNPLTISIDRAYSDVFGKTVNSTVNLYSTYAQYYCIFLLYCTTVVWRIQQMYVLYFQFR